MVYSAAVDLYIRVDTKTKGVCKIAKNTVWKTRIAFFTICISCHGTALYLFIMLFNAPASTIEVV